MELAHPLQLSASTLLEFRSVFMGIFDHSSWSAFVRSGIDVGWEGLAHSLLSNSSQSRSIRSRSGLCVQASQVPPHQTSSSCLYGPCFGIGTSPNCFHKVGSMKLSKMSWYAEKLGVPFTGTKGPSPTPEKQPHKELCCWPVHGQGLFLFSSGREAFRHSLSYLIACLNRL